MRTRIFSLVFISAMISIFVFGILVVKAQEQPKEPEKKEETDKSAEKRELTDEEVKTKVAELVKLLSSDDFKEREKAKEELIKLGDRGIPYMEEAIKNTEDLEVSAKLREVIDLLKSAKKSEDNKGTDRPLLPGSGFAQKSISYSITDATGIYKYETLDDGSLRITAMPNGGEKEVREFESEAKFKEEWPEVYAKFKQVKFYLKLNKKKLGDNDDDDEAEPEEDDGESEDSEGIPPAVKEMIERLKKEYGREFGKELDKELEKEMDPQKSREGHQQYYMGMRTDEEGNQYKITIEGGKVTAEFKGKDGTSTVKSYDDYENFKKDWPEFAALFPWLDKEYKPYKSAEPNKTENKNRVEDAVMGEVSDVLQAQLKIKEGVGLVIEELVNELEEIKGLFKKAGFERYDVLLEVGGEEITGIETLKTKLEALKEGENLVIKIVRGGNREEITITK